MARAVPTTTLATSPSSAAAAKGEDALDDDGFYSDAASAASSDSAAPLVVYEAQYPDHNLDVQVTRLKTKAAGKNGIKTTTTVSISPTPGAPLPPPSLLVHWGSDGFAVLPAKECWPANSKQAGEAAVQTPLGQNGISVVFESDGGVPPPPSFLFVLHDSDAGTWANDQVRDFRIPLSESSTEGLLARVLGAEGNPNGTWSLFNRFALAADLLPEAEAMGSAGLAVILTWFRLSSIRVLPWYGGTCYQSKDAAHIQQRLAERVAVLLQEEEGKPSPLDGEARSLARAALALLPRGGGGGGDDIRMGILHIMRDHGIREGHRPGIEEPFLEQWHQKLHTNTTPEDVTICEAYLCFLRESGGDEGVFWRVLWDAGRVTKEDLATMDHPITHAPRFMPHLVPAFEHYLWILKTTHAGADLDTSFAMARGSLDGSLAWSVEDLLSNRSAWWAPGKVVEVREALRWAWTRPGAPRDVAMLDIALDNFLRLSVERMDWGSMAGDDICSLVVLLLRNATIGGARDSEDLFQCRALWERVADSARGSSAENNGSWSADAAKLVLSASQRTSLALAAQADRVVSLTQPVADAFLEKIGREKIDPAYIANFGEEVVRGSPTFVLSGLLRAIDSKAREAAGAGSWEIVAGPPAGSGSSADGGSIVGVIRSLGSLSEIAGDDLTATPTIVVADAVGGNEDIPLGVVAVLTSSVADALSHMALRARAQRVLLATCFDEAALAALAGSAGKRAALRVSAAGDVTAALAEAEDTGGGKAASASSAAASASASASASAASSITNASLELPKPSKTKEWVLSEEEYSAEGAPVGGKAGNLAALRQKLAASSSSSSSSSSSAPPIRIPNSVALPHGTFERLLVEPINAALAKDVAKWQAEADKAAASASRHPLPAAALASLRRAVRRRLRPTPELSSAMAAKAAAAGLIASESVWKFSKEDCSDASTELRAAWRAISAVFASKWTDRAWLARRAAGVVGGDASLFMGVLVQEVVPAAYSFVLHTSDPTARPGEGEEGAVYGELVVGAGDALVGAAPGRAAAFRSSPSATAASGRVATLALPSKRLGWFVADAGAPGLIARSDSNGEDLGAFSGAGLHDSVTLSPLETRTLDYSSERIVFDASFREETFAKLGEVGRAVKEAMKEGDQDVEGVVSADGSVACVQARPQVV